jgi:hypothetical protein
MADLSLIPQNCHPRDGIPSAWNAPPEGNAAIERAGRHACDFRPGDLLSDYVRHYVFAGTQQKSLGAVTQVEALSQSA